jgi:RNA polymerase sigma factor (sigma-70 family)
MIIAWERKIMNEKMFNEIYTELVVPMVHRYYNYDKKLYNSDMLDAEDLKQEIAIILIEKMKEGEKTNEELSKFINTVIRTKLKQIKRNIINRNGIMPIIDNIEGLENLPEKTNDYNEIFEDIKNLCKEEEYDMIYDRLIDKYTFKEIGEKYGFSERYAKKRLKDIFKKKSFQRAIQRNIFLKTFLKKLKF